MRENKKYTPARAIATVGIMAAVIECAKLALAGVPNVEVVTLLVAVCGYSFGWLGVLATLVFVCIEPIIWGFGTWFVSYLLYWPFVALAFMLLGRARVRSIYVLTATALLFTVWFGVFTSLVDVGLLSGSYDNFIARFAVYYARGWVFYLIQLASNAVTFPLLFRPLAEKLNKIAN